MKTFNKVEGHPQNRDECQMLWMKTVLGKTRKTIPFLHALVRPKLRLTILKTPKEKREEKCAKKRHEENQDV